MGPCDSDDTSPRFPNSSLPLLTFVIIVACLWYAASVFLPGTFNVFIWNILCMIIAVDPARTAWMSRVRRISNYDHWKNEFGMYNYFCSCSGLPRCFYGGIPYIFGFAGIEDVCSVLYCDARYLRKYRYQNMGQLIYRYY